MSKEEARVFQRKAKEKYIEDNNKRGNQLEIIRTAEEIAVKWYFDDKSEYSINEIIGWLTGMIKLDK